MSLPNHLSFMFSATDRRRFMWQAPASTKRGMSMPDFKVRLPHMSLKEQLLYYH